MHAGEQRPHATALGLAYLLALPATWVPGADTRWPLVIYLHGAGESGSDPRDLLSEGATGTPPMLAARPSGLGKAFIVASPQTNTGWTSADAAHRVLGLLDELLSRPSLQVCAWGRLVPAHVARDSHSAASHHLLNHCAVHQVDRGAWSLPTCLETPFGSFPPPAQPLCRPPGGPAPRLPDRRLDGRSRRVGRRRCPRWPLRGHCPSLRLHGERDWPCRVRPRCGGGVGLARCQRRGGAGGGIRPRRCSVAAGRCQGRHVYAPQPCARARWMAGLHRPRSVDSCL